MIVGKLYECTNYVRGTCNFGLYPGAIILPVHVWNYAGKRKGRWRKGLGFKFLMANPPVDLTEPSQLKFCWHPWTEFFKLVDISR